MPITFTGDYNAYFRPANTPFKDLIEEASWRGATVTRSGDDGTLTVTDAQDLDIPTYMAIVTAGLNVAGLPVWIKMSPATYTGDVPTGIPNRSYDDGQGNTVTRKWSEWKDSTHEHMDAADGDKIVPGNSWGSELTGSEAKVLYDLVDYELLTSVTLPSELPAPEQY